MPHNKIADRKGHQGWMKVEGPYFVFPGGGTMFPGGAGEYIEKLKQYVPLTGGTLRTALDMGCGVGAPSMSTFFCVLLNPVTRFMHAIVWLFVGGELWWLLAGRRRSDNVFCT